MWVRLPCLNFGKISSQNLKVFYLDNKERSSCWKWQVNTIILQSRCDITDYMFICDKANFFVDGKILYTANCSLHSPLFFRKIVGHLRKNKRLWIVYCTIVYTSHLLAVSFYCLLAKQENIWMLTGLKPKTTLIIPCEQRLHFRCVSCRAKSSLWLRRGAIIVACGQNVLLFAHLFTGLVKPQSHEKTYGILNLLDSYVTQVVLASVIIHSNDA